jgi:hypothetical protein
MKMNAPNYMQSLKFKKFEFVLKWIWVIASYCIQTHKSPGNGAPPLACEDELYSSTFMVCLGDQKILFKCTQNIC